MVAPYKPGKPGREGLNAILPFAKPGTVMPVETPVPDPGSIEALEQELADLEQQISEQERIYGGTYTQGGIMDAYPGYAPPSNEEFLYNAYQSYLGRDPDDYGWKHFMERLQSGEYTQQDVLSVLQDSAEFRARTPEQQAGAQQQMYDLTFARPSAEMTPPELQLPEVPNVLSYFENFETSPGYQFRQDEAARALERQAAARGYRMSPRAAMELQERSQGLAAQEYGDWYNRQMGRAGLAMQDWALQAQRQGLLGADWYNRAGFQQAQENQAVQDWMNQYNALMGMAGMGAGAAGQTGSQSIPLTGQIAGGYQQQGQAGADLYTNLANIFSQGLTSGVNNWLLYNALNQNSPGNSGLWDFGAGST
jgi:hypothetical protein